RRVLVEGGGLTVSRFVHAGVIDRFHLLVAPLLIGSGRPGLALPPIDTVDEALRPACRLFRCGEDTVFDLDFGRAGGLPKQG
ncbi:MAG: dihydrofolate reductase family protein, partial [Thauera sp.]|nr:dihydrofolate reductase family protein [Thauera sp.]